MYVDNRQYLGQPPYGALQASTSHAYRKGSSCQPSDGHILSNKAWCAAQQNSESFYAIFIIFSELPQYAATVAKYPVIFSCFVSSPSR